MKKIILAMCVLALMTACFEKSKDTSDEIKLKIEEGASNVLNPAEKDLDNKIKEVKDKAKEATEEGGALDKAKEKLKEARDKIRSLTTDDESKKKVMAIQSHQVRDILA